MRKYGEIDEVYFTAQGFSIYNLAYEYKLSGIHSTEMVYVNNMTELKQSIKEFNAGKHSEQSEISMRSMQHYS